ncbi:MAG TPA: alginate export family protein [Planctomycetota bacterium]|jgi:hypothetical protein|nr:alginate export family protein [Planctomycetota bacterium]
MAPGWPWGGDRPPRRDNSRAFAATSWLLGPLALLAPIRAQETRPAASVPPRYEVLRYEEDYGYLADPDRRTDPFDPLKYMRLGRDDRFLSIGGDVRERYEHYRNLDFAAAPQDRDGYLLQRTMLHADLHLGEPFRLFAQLKSNLVSDRAGGPGPTDKDALDLHQAFFDLAVPLEQGRLTLRTGRQELAYGSQRLVSVRDGPNVRRSFDAARAILERGPWRADAFVAKPVETDPGIFDDASVEEESFWGFYSTGRVLAGLDADLYYLGLDRHDATFAQGTGDELRHSIGTRVFGKDSSFDYNFEAVFQWGEFGRGEIRAWTLASDSGLTLRDLPLSPRLGLKANVQSGDRDPGDSDLETFNPLFPRGKYFGETGIVGPVNLRDLHPTVRLRPCDRVTLDAGWTFYWRQSLDDGVYDNGVNLLASGAGARERRIGSEISFTLEWSLGRHVALGSAYAHFLDGPFLREVGLGRDVDYAAVTLTFRF